MRERNVVAVIFACIFLKLLYIFWALMLKLTGCFMRITILPQKFGIKILLLLYLAIRFLLSITKCIIFKNLLGLELSLFTSMFQWSSKYLNYY